MAKVIKAKMTAINGAMYPNKDYTFIFDSGDESVGFMEFPPGVTIINIGQTVTVIMKLEHDVKAKEGDKAKDEKQVGAAELIDIVD